MRPPSRQIEAKCATLASEIKSPDYVSTTKHVAESKTVRLSHCASAPDGAFLSKRDGVTSDRRTAYASYVQREEAIRYHPFIPTDFYDRAIG